ncbi:MAG: hypothetical protein ACXWBY_04565, partial [Kaistella sp.]
NNLLLLITALFLLLSCSVNTETTYYKDAATSMESHILADKSMLGMLSVMNTENPVKKVLQLSNLSTEWKSLYDIQKDGKITLNRDSAKVLQKMFMKLNKEQGEIFGVSLKYDKLLPGEVAMLLSQSKQLKRIPLQNVAQWDGKQLIIDTEKFNSTEFLNEIGKNNPPSDNSKPKTKSDSLEVYGKQMAKGMVGMMKMFNMNFTSTMKFQKPIKSITGKHDFVKQIDPKTIQINVRSNDLLDEGKSLTNKDKKIIIVTE